VNKSAMNRLEMIILAVLNKNMATSQASAVSIYEIKDYACLQQSIATIYRAIQKLYNLQNINIGLKDSKSNTYYITENGMRILKEMA
jgi:DNA-binding PadR family transcriptional regulator